MSKFLANIGAALRAPGFGDRLQAALAAAGGDTAAIARLRALQLQRAELQRQNDARDAQVIGAKNLGFSNDEIGAMGAQDLSLAARQRMALGSAQSPVADEGDSSAIDRESALRHADVAIQRGADPEAVRARLQEMGHVDQAPPSPFSDLIPNAAQTSEIAGRSGVPAPAETPSLTSNQFGPERRVSPFANPEVTPGSLRGRSDPSKAPSKLGRRVNYSQSGPVGHVFDLVNDFQRALTTQSGGAIRGGEPKPARPRSIPDEVVLSSPRTGGPRTPVPQRSYPVPPYRLGGGLNGHGYTPRSEDAQLLARAIYSESGITPEDMPAIGWAIVNRVGFRNGSRNPSYGDTLTDVINQRLANGLHAYSFLDDGGSAAWRRSANPSNIADPAVWARAVAAANAILSGRISDPTRGAQHYFSSSTYNPQDRSSARSDFPTMLRDSHYIPSPYQSGSTATENGRPLRNYLFIENPVKLWAPAAVRRRGR